MKSSQKPIDKTIVIKKLAWVLTTILALTLNTALSNAQSINYEWGKSFGSKLNDEGKSLITGKDGYVYIVGYMRDTVYLNINNKDSIFVKTPGNNRDMFLAKYNSDGALIWFRQVASEGLSHMNGITLDDSGFVYVVGQYSTSIDFNTGGIGGQAPVMSSPNDQVGYIAKYNFDGDFEWFKIITPGTLGGVARCNLVAWNPINKSITVTGTYSESVDLNSGGLGGKFNSQSGFNQDIFLASYTFDGEFLWGRGMGGVKDDYVEDIAIDQKGNILITGVYDDRGLGVSSTGIDFNPGGTGGLFYSLGHSDAFLIKYDIEGNYIGGHSIGSTTSSEINNTRGEGGYSLAVDQLNNVYMVGLSSWTEKEDTSGIIDFNSGGINGKFPFDEHVATTFSFLVKYDSDLNFQWVNILSNPPIGNFLSNVATDHYGFVYTGGLGLISSCCQEGVDLNPKDSGKPHFVAGDYIAKYNSDGILIWSKRVGGEVYKMDVSADGDIYVISNVPWNGVTFDPDGIKDVHKSNGSSDVGLLKFNQKCENIKYLNELACEKYEFNGIQYTQSGSYVHNFVNALNCDSIITLNLIIAHPTDNPIVKESYCAPVYINGIFYSKSGTYIQEYKNVNGCDSNMIYELIIGGDSTLLEYTHCNSFAYNGVSYSKSGTYFVELVNANGCDSIVQLDLTIKNISKSEIVSKNGTLFSNQAESYQWFDCDDNNALIPEATNQTFKPSITGNYGVITTVDGCSDTSACTYIKIDKTNILTIDSAGLISYYPNPVKDYIRFQSEQYFSQASVRMFNVLGQQVHEMKQVDGQQFQIDMQDYTPGIYFVEIKFAGKVKTFKVTKE